VAVAIVKTLKRGMDVTRKNRSLLDGQEPDRTEALRSYRPFEKDARLSPACSSGPFLRSYHRWISLEKLLCRLLILSNPEILTPTVRTS
ncbi:hypothetical protein CRG98_031452, partial [Punica granatum]